MRVLILAVILSLAPFDSMSHDADREVECEEIKQKIRIIYSKMRAGYTRAQGERMEEELRKLRALRTKACR